MHTAERFFVIGRSLLLFMHTCPVTEFAAFKYGKFLLPPRFLTGMNCVPSFRESWKMQRGILRFHGCFI